MNEIITYLKDAEQKNLSIGQNQLLRTFVPPLNDGLSCLATLPLKVQHLVPEPYRQLAIESTINKIYDSCMDPVTNVFDAEVFERRCHDRIKELCSTTKMANSNAIFSSTESRVDEDTVRLSGDKFWTVVWKSKNLRKRSFRPPEPFCKRVKSLNPNRSLNVSRLLATQKPRWMNANNESCSNDAHEEEDEASTKTSSHKTNDRGMNNFLMDILPSELKSINSIKYDTPFIKKSMKPQSRKFISLDDIRKDKKNMRQNPKNNVLPSKDIDSISATGQAPRKIETSEDYIDRENQSILPLVNRNKMINALQCLNELEYSKCVDSIEWEVQAGISDTIETVTLKVSRSQHNSKNSPSVQSFSLCRDISISRKLIKNNLATMALENLIGSKKDWRELTLNEIKKLVSCTNKND